MNGSNSNRLIQSLAQLLAERPSDDIRKVDAEHVERLLAVYYRHLAPDDLSGWEPEDLLGALLAHWHLMRQRRPDEAKLRVYNPDYEAHGWRTHDTVIEVVCQDMPFLVDSISWALNNRGLALHLTLHPVFAVARDGEGRLTDLHDPKTATEHCVNEAVMRFHVDRQPAEALADLQRSVAGVLADVRAATTDWLKMRELCSQVMQDFGESGGSHTASDTAEGKAFLDWMINDHFLFLATCTLTLHDNGDGDVMRCEPGTGLGLFSDDVHGGSRAEQWVAGLGSDIIDAGADLMVTKASARSTVHRPAFMDLVAVKRRDAEGAVNGVYCIIGLFSSGAYSTPPRQIPLLRRKIEQVYAGAQVVPNSHSGRVIANILDNFPRDTLFQINDDDLLATTLGVLSLQERQRTRLFIVRDPFQRFYSCLVYLPRERYRREMRIAVQEILAEALGAIDVVFETHFSESILARIYFVIITPPCSTPEYDIDDLEARIVAATTTWQDGLHDALFAQVDEALATRYLKDYATAFPSGFQDDFHPRIAVNDIQRIECLRERGGLALHLYHPLADREDTVHIRLYALGDSVPLSEVIPVLEHMGLRVFGERPYRIRHQSGPVWIHDFETRRPSGTRPITAELNDAFTETFLRIWQGDVDDDGFNGLVLQAGFTWKEASLFRAYGRYQHQINVPYTEAYMIAVLNRHPVIVQLLNEVFHLQFDPQASRDESTLARVLERFESLLNDVESLDEDTILRGYLKLIQATLRTNYFQTDEAGDGKPYLSFKIDPGRIDGMPLPMPMYEIFVFSRHMEGVHLRGGKVARGGLRWSDRMEDYRTEILGLMKAQMVKNTVIVPVGSKGGFIVKSGQAGDSREQRLQKGIACYQTLLRGMLDITDNLVGGDVVPPARVIRRDADDPYLVIAADKGTATFSDIANQISADYGFWLGDAFASGGSEGYDHKAMGITARGAWESVKRHFRELSVDIQSTPFTVAGIGDMSGDVFGNGMLLSPHIRLVAAFNHQHIFIDPDPDAERSFDERQRLFMRPRSSWSDYDRALISSGGGIYARSAKSIVLEPEARRLLDLNVERITPNRLIRAILRARVDLLWNGGIGTYVKASSETDAQVHDKANDAVRVNAGDLRCRVVGEGGNLGFTQLARVEYALGGGRIYTDAIDNSAGVDCSDHEVNIKILLDKIVADGDMTGKQRNQLLRDMTDDVARLVLADNYAQTQAISMAVADAAERLYEQARFMDLLEQNGALDRELEGLPGKKVLTERLALGQGLTKPEVAVLLAYSKMNYFDAVVTSDIPDDPFVADRLIGYFPPVLGERFGDMIRAHRLRREIVATVVAGSISDNVGPGIGFRVREEVGTDIAGVARAFLVASTVFETDRLRGDVEALDNRVPADTQMTMLTAIAAFLESSLTGILRSYKDCLDMQKLQQRFQPGVCELWKVLPENLANKDRQDLEQHQQQLVDAGVPAELAMSIAALDYMTAALDIVDVAQGAGVDNATAAWVYSALGETLELDWVSHHLSALAVHTHWHLLARTKLQAGLMGHRRNLAAQVLKGQTGGETPSELLAQWVENNSRMLNRHDQMMAEFKAGNVFDFAIMSLVVAGVGELLPTTYVGDES